MDVILPPRCSIVIHEIIFPSIYFKCQKNLSQTNTLSFQTQCSTVADQATKKSCSLAGQATIETVRGLIGSSMAMDYLITSRGT